MPKQATPPLHLHPLPPLAPVDGIGPGVGLAFVRAYFPLVQGSLRIATAYFSLKGYTMAFAYLPQRVGVRLKILVGKRDGYQVERTVLEDLRAELRQGVKLATLYDAVADLYRRMEAGELTICDARQMERPFHCKFYLIDAAGIFHGSANFSLNGLNGQAEQLTYSTDTKRVANWTAWFEKVAAGATDLHAELRKLLAEWLKMPTPFQVYLRALELLLTPMRELNHKAGAHSPVPYQRTLAAWAERQLIAHKGAILVVATGLGKTIIGAETVGQLWRAGRIERVLVLAPPLVHKAWSNELKGRGLQKGRHYEQFGLKALFRAEPVPGGQTARLLEELNQANSEKLILVDEAHEYRNQQQATQAKLLNKTKRRDKASSGSLVFDRLKPALAAGAQVLLLTGSAYGTSRLNLSSLLRLLPPTAPVAPAAEATELELQVTAPTEPPYWTASTPADFGLLPEVDVFTYPHALYLARLEQPGATNEPGEVSQPPFLPFAHGPGYLPLGIHSEPVYYSPPHWQEILTAFDRGCFAQEVPITTEGYTDETGPIIGKTDVVNKQALAAWLSSPAALRETIEHNLATVGPALTKQGTLPLLLNLGDLTSAQTATPTPNVSRQLPLWEADEAPATTQKQRNSKTSKRSKNASYNTNLRLTQEERQRQLAPIQALLHAGIEEDPKFKVLYRLLHDLCVVNRGQAIIFVRLHATAAYLGKRLQAAFKPAKLQVACTVTARGDLKSLAERQLLREQFAPVANGKDEAARYQLLVCTDADGVGVNLQDAANVINYDLPASADGLVQRLGRILRPARYAGRVPHMYTFIPDCLHPSQTAPSSSLTVQAIAQLVERLRRRHVACSQLLGFPVLGTNSDPYIPLDVAIDPAALADKLSENWQGLSTTANTWTSHIANLAEHRSMLSALPKVLHSARLCKQRNPQVIVLLEYDKGVVPIVYDIQSDRLIDLHDLPILNLLRADLAEKPAGVNMPRIIRYADLATRRWCERTHVRPKLTKRMAALYLHPEHQAEDFDYLLKVE